MGSFREKTADFCCLVHDRNFIKGILLFLLFFRDLIDHIYGFFRLFCCRIYLFSDFRLNLLGFKFRVFSFAICFHFWDCFGNFFIAGFDSDCGFILGVGRDDFRFWVGFYPLSEETVVYSSRVGIVVFADCRLKIDFIGSSTFGSFFGRFFYATRRHFRL